MNARDITFLSFLGDALVGLPQEHESHFVEARSRRDNSPECVAVLDVLEHEFTVHRPLTRDDVAKIQESLRSTKDIVKQQAARVLTWGLQETRKGRACE